MSEYTCSSCLCFSLIAPTRLTIDAASRVVDAAIVGSIYISIMAEMKIFSEDYRHLDRAKGLYW